MPSKLFENIVVVGLHPSFDVQMLRKCLKAKKCEVSGRLRFALSRRSHSHVEPNFEPQVLFAFPPEKQLPVKCRDFLSFCFPGGVEVHAIERNSSMTELNEILLGQEHLKQSDLSFVFRLQVPNSSPLYGCCVLMEELLDKPSPLISMISDHQAGNSHLERHIFTTRRCYCILSHLPFFELHFGVLNRMFMEERLECLSRSMSILDQVAPDNVCKVDGLEENESCLLPKHLLEDEMHENNGTSQSSFSDASVSVDVSTIGSHFCCEQANHGLFPRLYSPSAPESTATEFSTFLQVGVQNKTSEVQSKLTNAILVDVSNNQVRSPSLLQLPKQDELLSSSSPCHSKLVGEGHSASQRPIFECTDEQVEAAKGFMEVLRNYLGSLCCNLHSHVTTNVQSNDDEVSQLSKESFVDSFPSCDRPFMKFFVDAQLFSVHTDLVLFVSQKD